mmetsp:Transcript_74832/g.243004  ORF Transcript_74832/g.243004 Transcript_74832/m.243004 type:complete len:236 (-) Transcript_74832:406-1113(-)
MSGVLNSDSFFRDSEVAPETALATATAFATADSAPAAGRAVDTTMTFGGPGSGILAALGSEGTGGLAEVATEAKEATAGAAPAAEATEAATASRGRGIKVGAAAGAPAGDADEPHGLPPGDVGGCRLSHPSAASQQTAPTRPAPPARRIPAAAAGSWTGAPGSGTPSRSCPSPRRRPARAWASSSRGRCSRTRRGSRGGRRAWPRPRRPASTKAIVFCLASPAACSPNRTSRFRH